MPATVSHVVKQFQQDWTRQLEPDAIRSACHDIGSQWRQRLLDPVVTMPRFFVQILHGKTACTPLRHLAKLTVTASASCQARIKLPLRVFQRGLQGVSARLQHQPLDEGRWLGPRTFGAEGSSFAMPDTPRVTKLFWPTRGPEARLRLSRCPPDEAVSCRHRHGAPGVGRSPAHPRYVPSR